MGNEALKTCVPTSTPVKLASCLTSEQIRLIQDTWRILRRYHHPASGVIIFTKFFQMNPDMKSLFPKIITINEENRLELIVDEKMLQKHASTVMSGLGAAVDSLQNPYVLENVLEGFGQSHARRHVKPGMLKRLWPALDFGFSECLGDHYTKESSEAWKKFYDYICVRMKDGIRNLDDDLT